MDRRAGTPAVVMAFAVSTARARWLVTHTASAGRAAASAWNAGVSEVSQGTSLWPWMRPPFPTTGAWRTHHHRVTPVIGPSSHSPCCISRPRWRATWAMYRKKAQASAR